MGVGARHQSGTFGRRLCHTQSGEKLFCIGVLHATTPSVTLYQLRVQLNKCDTVQLWVSHSGERTFCQTVTGKDSPCNCAAVAATPLRPCEYLDNCDSTVNHPPTLPSSWKITYLTMPCIFCSRYSFLGSPCPNWRFLTICISLNFVKCAPNPKYNPGIFVKLSSQNVYFSHIKNCIFAKILHGCHCPS